MKTDIPILPKESSTDMYKDIRDNENLLNFWTGLPNTSLFNYVLEIVKQRKPYKCKTLTQENHLLLVLMKLKLGLLHTDLAYRFSLSLSSVSRIYKSWIMILSEELEIFLLWPERDVLRRNLLESRHEKSLRIHGFPRFLFQLRMNFFVCIKLPNSCIYAIKLRGEGEVRV